MKINKILIYLSLATVLLIAALPLAGCTGTGSSAGTTAKETTAATAADTASATTVAVGTNPASKNEVLIESNTFKPDTITIKAGDTVTWINNETYAHTVKAKNGEFDSGNMATGAKFSFTFGKEGTYDYICGIHTFMTGKVIVTK